jgi:hypothetical protein
VYEGVVAEVRDGVATEVWVGAVFHHAIARIKATIAVRAYNPSLISVLVREDRVIYLP